MDIIGIPGVVGENTRAKRAYIECSCDHPAHLIIFSYDKVENSLENGTKWYEHEWDVSYRLNYLLPWYKRIWYAIQYVFKKDFGKSHYYFDNIMWDKEQVEKIRDFLDSTLKEC